MWYERLLLLRQEQGVCIPELAEKVGLPVKRYEQLESGQRELMVSDLEKLANYYNVPTDFILERTDERKTQ